MTIVSAMARVQVTLEIPTGSWREDCTLNQIFSLASKEAIGSIRRSISEKVLHPDTKIIGEPKVLAILMPSDGKEGNQQ